MTMYEAFREAPQSKKDRSRLKLGLWITLAAVLLALTNWVKPTKNLHPIVFIAASAVVGVVFRFAGV